MDNLAYVISAFVLGALHALEPGHGKTIVAAYLVGSKGRVREAVLLGGVVTFTHTFSIIVLGLLTAFAAAYLVPETVHEGLEVVSGLLVVGVGVWMIRSRILSKGDGHAGDTPRGAGDTPDPGTRTPGTSQTSLSVRVRPCSSVSAGTGAHGDTPHGAGDTPDPGMHRHPHDHGHSHALPDARKLGLGGLVTLGISGGIVPCPGALALLLAAVALGNVLAGVSLVIVFSLGLASILIAIGIVLVKAADVATRHLGDGFGPSGRFTRYAGAASAIVVTLLGVAMTVRAILDVTGTRPLY